MWTWIVIVERETRSGRMAATLQSDQRWSEQWMAEANIQARMSETPFNIPDFLQGDEVQDVQVVWVAK